MPNRHAADPLLTEHALADALSRVADRFLRDVDAHAGRHCTNIHAAIDDFDGSATVTAQSREAVRSTLVAFAVYVRQAELAPEVRVPSEAADYARAFVERRFPLRALLRTYLLGQAELWRTWSAVVDEADLDARIERLVLERTQAQMLRFIERLTVGVVDIYETEREERTRSMAAIRADVIRGLLDREPTDVAEAELILRYALGRTHIALVIWTGERDEASPDRDTLWSAVVEHAGASSHIAMSAGRNVTWAWLGGNAEEMRRVADRLDGWPVPGAGAGAGVAFSEPLRGVTGFRSGHRQALHVRRVADSAPRRPTTARRFNAVAVPAMAGMEPSMASFFVQQQLGALGDDDDAVARLRSTLAVYFDEGESTAATAHRLGVHVNTVTYRLRQAERLLGRPPTQHRLETQLALRLAPFVTGRED